MDKTSLGDRQKKHENITRNYLLSGVPVVIRLDGKSFSSVTKNCKKPFDHDIIDAMVCSALDTASEMQGFVIGYAQSDEITFILQDYKTINTDGWFGYNINKIVSISASLMTYYFNRNYKTDKLAVFDSRAFNVPRSDLSNCLLWRSKDWERNSLQMYCQSLFSHKQLHKKNKEDMHEMLHGIGKNWTTDLTDQEKNGTFFFRTEKGIEIRMNVPPYFKDINDLVNEYMPDTEGVLKPVKEKPKYMTADEFFIGSTKTTIAEDVQNQIAKENAILCNENPALYPNVEPDYRKCGNSSWPNDDKEQYDDPSIYKECPTLYECHLSIRCENCYHLENVTKENV